MLLGLVTAWVFKVTSLGDLMWGAGEMFGTVRMIGIDFWGGDGVSDLVFLISAFPIDARRGKFQGVRFYVGDRGM